MGQDADRAQADVGATDRSVAEQAAESMREEREGRLASRRREVRTRVALVAGVAFLVVVSCLAISRLPLFPIRRVEILGNSRVSGDQIIALAAVPVGSTLVNFPADEVAERVGRDPWIESVTVSRVFPDGMRIRIAERKPIAFVEAGKAFWLVDSTGMVLAKPSASETATLVMIRDVPGLDPRPGRRTGSEILSNALRALSGVSPELASKIRVISAPSVDGTTLYTRDKVEIVFGAAVEVRVKEDLVARILADLHGRVVSIDVRTTDRPTWRGLTP